MDIKIETLFRTDNENSPVKAYVDISFDEYLLIKGFRVIEGEKGLFVSPPCQMHRNGKVYDIVLFTNSKLKEDVENTIIKAYSID